MRAIPVIVAIALIALLLGVAPRDSSQPSGAEAADFPAAQLSTSLLFECVSGSVLRVHLSWGSSGQGLQWVDVSQHNDNFSIEAYLTHGPLPPFQSQFAWDGLAPSTWYFVRVNTLAGDTWHPSDTLLFFTPNECASVPAPLPSTGVSASSSPARCSALPVERLAGCVWNRPERLSYNVGEGLDYCYFVTQPAELLILVRKPDGTVLVVVDGFANATGACLGPFRADRPLGERSVEMYDKQSGQLLDRTTFGVR
jgi:hypothetical protein